MLTCPGASSLSPFVQFPYKNVMAVPLFSQAPGALIGHWSACVACIDAQMTPHPHKDASSRQVFVVHFDSLVLHGDYDWQLEMWLKTRLTELLSGNVHIIVAYQNNEHVQTDGVSCGAFAAMFMHKFCERACAHTADMFEKDTVQLWAEEAASACTMEAVLDFRRSVA